MIKKKTYCLDFKTDKEFYYYFLHNENTTEIGLIAFVYIHGKVGN